MFWQVRAVLEDRPGAMAALAGLCGEHDMNILGLQIFPAAGGQVVDEFVLRTSVGWSAERVERLFSASGATVTTVHPCSARVLEDQPVRYLRAAHAVVRDPATLEDQLCGLLGAAQAGQGAGPETLVLDDTTGPAITLCRRTPFTDTEVARAAELHRLAASVGLTEVRPVVHGPSPVDGRPTVRPGSVDDVELVVAMHDRCSANSLYRRYHAPSPRTTARLARRLLAPPGGWSVVAEAGGQVVGIGMVAGAHAEVGLLVEDGWQGRGLGSRMLDALVKEAVRRDIAELTCMALPGNGAVARTIHRAGLRARATLVDGVVAYTIPLPAKAMRRAGGRRVSPDKVTAPLVALLQRRQELREAYPVADFIDHAVRG